MKVFVYGTLLSGEGNHSLLRGARLLGQDETHEGYMMYHLGGFPGVVPSEGNETVKGEVYEINPAILERLDGLEGVNHHAPELGLYRRETITTQKGHEVFIYIFNKMSRASYQVIETGSWRNIE